MVFYETIHCGLGILKCEINEQYIWHWLTHNNKDKFRVLELCYAIEGSLEAWDWETPLHLNSLILKEYKKHERRFEAERKHQISDGVFQREKQCVASMSIATLP